MEISYVNQKYHAITYLSAPWQVMQDTFPQLRHLLYIVIEIPVSHGHPREQNDNVVKDFLHGSVAQHQYALLTQASLVGSRNEGRKAFSLV